MKQLFEKPIAGFVRVGSFGGTPVYIHLLVLLAIPLLWWETNLPLALWGTIFTNRTYPYPRNWTCAGLSFDRCRS